MHDTDGRRFYNTWQKCGCWLKKRNFRVEQLFNAPLHISRVAYWRWKNLSLSLATLSLTKSDRISLETLWLKFEIWRVAVSINCNFFRYLNQVSHRNNQSLPFFNFLTWYEVWFFLPISLYEYLQIFLWQNKLIFDTWVILKMIYNLQITHFFPLSQMMSRVITEPNFNSITGREIKSYRDAYPIPPSNHLYATHNRLMMFCAIWYHFYNFKNMKNTRGGVLLIVKLQAKSLHLYQK